jgi:hypothetical protein
MNGKSRGGRWRPGRFRIDLNGERSDTLASTSLRPDKENWGREESDLVTEDEYHRGFRHAFPELHPLDCSARIAHAGQRAEPKGCAAFHLPSRPEFLTRFSRMSSCPTQRPVGSGGAPLRETGQVAFGDPSAVMQVFGPSGFDTGYIRGFGITHRRRSRGRGGRRRDMSRWAGL